MKLDFYHRDKGEDTEETEFFSIFHYHIDTMIHWHIGIW